MPGGGLEPPTRGFSALQEIGISELAMIPFTTGQLPTGIYAPVYVEELHAWTGSILQFNYPTASYNEAQNTTQLFRYINPEIRIPDARLMRVFRCALEVDESAALTLPVWKRLKDPASTVIPAGFKITG